jgi:hypothetical protein
MRFQAHWGAKKERRGRAEGLTEASEQGLEGQQGLERQRRGEQELWAGPPHVTRLGEGG